MRTILAAVCFLIGTLLVPVAGYAADSDTDRSSPKAFVKDSVITTKIKAKLAAEKLSSAVHIKVETDNKGVVQLSGTAKNQAEVDKAGSIARGVEGVVSVENNIQIASAKARSSARGAKASGVSSEDRVEARIKDMHARLKITQAQEDQWSKVAQVMRDNAKQMDALTKTRAEKADMNAIDDLKSYGEIAEAHVDGMKKFTPIFQTLYDSMSDAQKKNADAVFRHGGRKASKNKP
jgi:protein CpxP